MTRYFYLFLLTLMFSMSSYANHNEVDYYILHSFQGSEKTSSSTSSGTAKAVFGFSNRKIELQCSFSTNTPAHTMSISASSSSPIYFSTGRIDERSIFLRFDLEDEYYSNYYYCSKLIDEMAQVLKKKGSTCSSCYS